MLELPFEVRLRNKSTMESARQLIVYSVLGAAILLYLMIETAVQMGQDSSTMKSSDQLMWLWIISYSFMSWPVQNKEDVYR